MSYEMIALVMFVGMMGMLLTGQRSIRDVILFPLMRPMGAGD